VCSKKISSSTEAANPLESRSVKKINKAFLFHKTPMPAFLGASPHTFALPHCLPESFPFLSINPPPPASALKGGLQ
jgi:hypothetical protein